jgi:hypothetical protein
MKKKHGCLLIALICVLAFWTVEEVLFWGPARRARRRVEAVVPQSILAACRDLMAQRSVFQGEEVVPDSEWVHVKLSSPEHQKMLPPPLVSLKPMWILIKTNHVTVGVHPPPCRVYLRAFAPGAKEFGSIKIIDGLWYQN